MSDKSWVLPESRFKLSDWVSLPDTISEVRLADSQRSDKKPSLSPETDTGNMQHLWSFFKLNENPFKESLDTHYFFETPQMKAALLQMHMVIQNNLGFALVTGEAGSGKSFLSQKILETINKTAILPVLITVAPQISAASLLTMMLEEMQRGHVQNKVFERLSVYEKIKYFGQSVYHFNDRGLHPVMVIDECHFLNREILHLLRTLNNFEARDKKCVTFILLGENQFLKKISHASYKSLKSRLYMEIELNPLSLIETAQYIRHRLIVSGGKGDELTDEQVKTIYSESGGIPRLIHKSATKMALHFYLSNPPKS